MKFLQFFSFGGWKGSGGEGKGGNITKQTKNRCRNRVGGGRGVEKTSFQLIEGETCEI